MISMAFFLEIKVQVLPSLLLGGWAALGKDCGELRKRHVTTLGGLKKPSAKTIGHSEIHDLVISSVR